MATENDKHKSFTIAGDDDNLVYIQIEHPTPEERHAAEQKMFNEALVRNVIQAIKGNEDLRHELITVLLDDVLNAVDWNKDDIRVRLRAALRIED
jgi:hypothetical protein